MRVEYCNMQIASTNFAKTLVGKRNMTSYYDIENSVYTVTMTTIRLCSILKFSCRAYNQAVVPDITRLLHATALVQEIHFLLGNSV